MCDALLAQNDFAAVKKCLRRGNVPKPFPPYEELPTDVMTEIVQAYLRNNLSVQTVVDGVTLLDLAVDIPDANLIKEIIRRGANINRLDKNGQTALIKMLLSADRRHNIDMVGVLLELGADPNVPDQDGVPPLHHAIDNNNVDQVKLLLAHHADKMAKDRDGLTAAEKVSRPRPDRIELYPELRKIIVGSKQKMDYSRYPGVKIDPDDKEELAQTPVAPYLYLPVKDIYFQDRLLSEKMINLIAEPLDIPWGCLINVAPGDDVNIFVSDGLSLNEMDWQTIHDYALLPNMFRVWTKHPDNDFIIPRNYWLSRRIPAQFFRVSNVWIDSAGWEKARREFGQKKDTHYCVIRQAVHGVDRELVLYKMGGKLNDQQVQTWFDRQGMRAKDCLLVETHCESEHLDNTPNRVFVEIEEEQAQDDEEKTPESATADLFGNVIASINKYPELFMPAVVLGPGIDVSDWTPLQLLSAMQNYSNEQDLHMIVADHEDLDELRQNVQKLAAAVDKAAVLRLIYGLENVTTKAKEGGINLAKLGKKSDTELAQILAQLNVVPDVNKRFDDKTLARMVKGWFEKPEEAKPKHVEANRAVAEWLRAQNKLVRVGNK